MKSVVVTGVSTGIGWGVTKALIAKGFRVFGSVRKQLDADRLRQEFGDRFVPLMFDVTDEVAVKTAAAKVSVALAGTTLAGLGPVEIWDSRIELGVIQALDGTLCIDRRPMGENATPLLGQAD